MSRLLRIFRKASAGGSSGGSGGNSNSGFNFTIAGNSGLIAGVF